MMDRMTESFVLHLQSDPLANGEVRGVVEVIATGERRTITTLDELRDLMVQRAGDTAQRGDTTQRGNAAGD
jgi:hypothetical protein